MATRDELYTALRNADAAGDTAGAQKLAAYIKSLPSPSGNVAQQIDNDAISQGAKNFNSDASTLDNLRAGFGKAVVDTGRGIAQLFGQVERSDVDEVQSRDAALMDSGAGKVGNFAGNLAIALPTVAIPGAASLRGAALIGGTQGALQQVGTEDSRLKNMGLGAAAGAGGVAAGRLLAAGYQGAKALAEPFTQAGREKIAGRVIQRFADDPTVVLKAQGAKSVTGATPTLAEETADAGLSRLQDALGSGSIG